MMRRKMKSWRDSFYIAANFLSQNDLEEDRLQMQI